VTEAKSLAQSLESLGVPSERRESAAPSILLVEDEMFIRMAMADALRHAGFEVYEAADGDEAFRLYSSSDITMLVTDIKMPGSINGISLAKLVRAQSPDVKIILVSATNYSVMASVADAVFFKPVSIAHMLDCVRSLISGTTPPHPRSS
jgi:DNA-binding response OmpR family regulator